MLDLAPPCCILFEREDAETVRQRAGGKRQKPQQRKEERGEENTKGNREKGESGGPCRVSGTPPTALTEKGRLRNSSMEAV